MKPLIVILISIILNVTIAQDVCQIADTAKTWNTVHGGFLAWMVAECSGTSSIKFGDTTIINGKTYLKVYESPDSLQLNWEQIGYIYEDTALKTVYFRNFWEEDGLLYDFSLDVGETVYIDNYYIGFNNVMLTCCDIDSVFLNGSFKKRYWLNSFDVWIEGIGSIYGLLCSGVNASGMSGGFSQLLCSSTNDTVIYMDSTFNTCYIDEFYPKIIQEAYDTAFLNTYYEFQLQLSGISNIDSIQWEGDYIPPNFSFNEETGLLTGMPESTGSFSCVITVTNCDIGYITDILYAEIVVLNQTLIPEQTINDEIELFPNPGSETITINFKNENLKYFCLEVYNLQGGYIEHHSINNQTSVKIDCSLYNKGIYLLKFLGSDNKIFVTKQVMIE
jgi:hypothetical protein